MLLLLMRHGIAEDIEAGTDAEDAARALTGKGRKETEHVAGRLKKLGLKPNVFLSSGRVRARQTAKIVARKFAAKRIEETDALDFTSTFAAFAEELNARAMKRKAAVIFAASHEPFCSEFLRHAIEDGGVEIPFAKSAVAVVKWKGEARPGTGKLLLYITPAIG